MRILPNFTNSDAHKFIKELMQNNEYLDITMKDNPYIEVCVKNVVNFPYFINSSSWEWIINYLKIGGHDDFGVNPNKRDILGTNLQTRILKELVDNGSSISRVPFLREYMPYITLIVFFPFGKLVFCIKRNQQIMDYLNSKGI